jgi:hypothetical protein
VFVLPDVPTSSKKSSLSTAVLAMSMCTLGI